MTRLLVPQMFGVMAIATTLMVGLAMFSDLGLTQNIVQSRRGSDPDYLNTVWTIQILRGFLLWSLALCISLMVFAANQLGLVPKASVYADPYLPYILASVSVTTVIAAFRSTKSSEATRDMLLGRLTQIQLMSQIAGLICTVGWVLLDRSIWSLVAGNICSAAVGTLLSHTWLFGSPNRLHWDRSALHEIIHFGKWMFLSSILGFFANNADRMLLAGYVDASVMGIYSVAFTIFSAVAQLLNKLISDVSYSALSEVVRERSSDLKQSLYRFHVMAASCSYFCAGGLMVSGELLIRLLYDSRYQQAGWMLEALATSLLAVPFNLAQYSLLARGLAKIFTNLVAMHAVAAIVFIPLGFHFFGLPGALWGIVTSQLSSLPATIYYQLKYDLFDLSKELLLLPLFFAGMIAAESFNLAAAHWLFKAVH